MKLARRWTKIEPRWLVSALFAVGSPAQAEVVEFRLEPGQAFERRISAAPEDFVELCAPLAQHQVVHWRFSADGALDFNIHRHEGDRVITPARRDAARAASGRLRASAADDYCWMWANSGRTPVQLTVRLRSVRQKEGR
jgi:hypothetical protein